MHWHSYHISILVHITYWSNPDFDGYEEDFKVFMEYYFYVSDDHKHDPKFVQHCFKLHWTKDLNQIGIMFGLMSVCQPIQVFKTLVFCLKVP
jgi:hypothetical protein